MSLLVEKLSFAYPGGRQVLREISFRVEPGELLAVLGPNGAGKSTLFRCLLGLLGGYSGVIQMNGKEISSLSPEERAKYVAYIPQNHGRMFGYSVLDTVVMGVAREVPAFGVPSGKQEEQAWNALERVGISSLAERSFSKLSGGEQQLVLLARALAQRAGILVMDEPTSSLDYGNQLRVLELVRTLSKEGYTVLLSTHNPQNALTFADRVLALCGGEMVALGRPETVLTPELVRTLYQVEARFAQVDGRRFIVPWGGEPV